MAGNLLADGLLVFGAMFGLQFVDRSSFAVIKLASRHSHLDVWLGASVGFLAATLVGIAIGLAAVSFLAPYLLWVKVTGGVVLIAFGLRELTRSAEERAEQAERQAEVTADRHRVRFAAFALVLLLEMGGNTQILTILFVASTRNVLLVLVAAWLALVSVTAIEIRGTRYLQAHLDPVRLERILAVILVVVGSLAIALAFFPAVLPPIGL